MSARTLQRWLCRIGQRIAPADMREWAEGMTREIEEIDDDRAALDWAAACFLSCVAQRLRAVLRIAATAARFLLGGYCLVVAGQVAIELVAQAGENQMAPWRTGAWLLMAIFFGATAPLVALRRPAATWTLSAATAVMAAIFIVSIVAVDGELAEAGSREILAAYAMVGTMLGLTGAAFWLTRRPADLTV